MICLRFSADCVWLTHASSPLGTPEPACCAFLFTGEVESALKYAREMLKQGMIVRHNFPKIVASYVITFITNWMILREEDSDKRKEEHEKIVKHAENVIHYLHLVSQDFFIAETILFYAETYSSLARDHSESKLQERYNWRVQEKKRR